MAFELRPFLRIDGVPTMRDSEIAAYYDQMVADGTISEINYEGKVPDAAALIRAAKAAQYFAVVVADGQEVGLVWLNRYEPRRAHLHFCVFSNGWGENCEAMGSWVLAQLLAIEHEGEYCLDVIWGIAPKANVRALAYVEQCGGQVLGVVPHSIWNAARGCSEDGVFFYLTR